LRMWFPSLHSADFAEQSFVWGRRRRPGRLSVRILGRSKYLGWNRCGEPARPADGHGGRRRAPQRLRTQEIARDRAVRRPQRSTAASPSSGRPRARPRRLQGQCGWRASSSSASRDWFGHRRLSRSRRSLGANAQVNLKGVDRRDQRPGVERDVRSGHLRKERGLHRGSAACARVARSSLRRWRSLPDLHRPNPVCSFPLSPIMALIRRGFMRDSVK
jgi:hypothetical protein